MKSQIPPLQSLVHKININPKDPQIPTLILQSATNIANFTTEMIAAEQNAHHQDVITKARKCALDVKALLSNLDKDTEVMKYLFFY